MKNVKNVVKNDDKEKNDELSNIEAEIALIGCLLRDNSFFEKIGDFLLPELIVLVRCKTWYEHIHFIYIVFIKLIK